MSWWRRTQATSPVARLAVPADRPVLAALLANTWRRFGALAVEEQLALLDNGSSALAFDAYEPMGFLGLSPRAPTGEPLERWADVAMLVVAPNQGAGRTVSLLLETVLAGLQAQAVTGLACVAADHWVSEALAEARFFQVDRVINYTRPAGKIPPAVPPTPASLRPAVPADMGVILDLNAAAFRPFWRYDPQTTASWLLTADHAVVAELEGRPVGFALTTRAILDEYAQLMRVATHPSVQGRGVGRQLVADAIRFAHESGTPGLSLNTQASNAVSRYLYESLGFHLTGAPVAVMMLRM
ncbi:MAG: GNAT family N-acetyltransferase [Chloroflexi bacterium]|nr:GNAT family N-acetyltransferase [Chloroflexota bacterium]